MKVLSRRAREIAIRREAPAADVITLSAMVDPFTIQTDAGDFVQTFEFDGIAHETASDTELTSWHETLCQFAKAIASPHHAMWSYTLRSPLQAYPTGSFRPGYAHDLNERYKSHALKQGQFGTRLLLAVLFRPYPGQLDKFGAKLDKHSAAAALIGRKDAIARLESIDRDVHKWLGRWSPRRLGTYERNGLVFSEALEFYGELINGYQQPMPLRRANIGSTLMTARPFFGTETFELRGPDRSSYGAMLEFKEFPDELSPGSMDELLRINTPLALVQSFAFTERSEARTSIDRHIMRLENVEDDAQSQHEELREAKDDLRSQRFAIGVHHITLMVRTPSLDQLPEFIAEARQAMAAGGGIVTRASIEMEAAFWSTLPGAFNRRPRPGMLTSRQWAALNSMHSYPSGRPSNNHWGPAIALMKTANGSPYFMNFHQADVGHFCVIGSTGVGKTVLTTFLMAMLTRLDVQMNYFDKDRGAEIGIRAMGGEYFPLRPERPTGFAPFALPDTPDNKAAVRKLMQIILRDRGAPHSSRELDEINQAVNGAWPLGRMANMLEFLEPPQNNNLAQRLKRWVQSIDGDGELAWIFDNDIDLLDLNKARINGFDMTYFLDDPEISSPIMMYLQHRIEQLKDGRRLATFIDEGWRALDDPILDADVRVSLKTDRKKNALIGLITQDPTDALESRAARAIIGQTPTKIFLPNIEANKKDYLAGFGMTEGEFETFSKLTPESRQLMVKQGKNSVICEFDLSGFPNDINVLSGTTESVQVLDDMMAAHGPDPADWLSSFINERALS